jgi:UDP:flavonoid glycosyltransferase YjiC (YdhE family)
VPIVSAGLTEDKAEVNARIGWSGAGINLATNTPSADALRVAVTRVLDEPSFRQQAAALRDAFAARDAMTGILGAIDDLARTGSVLRGGASAAVPLARSA